jgi:beta-glucosidase/6-phospho-beta-glucosidase/beta-galactosidase
MPCWTETLASLLRMYAERYTPIPVMVSETGATGAMARRVGWIEESAAAVLRARDGGLPVAGYTYWPVYSLVAWAYVRGNADFARYLLHLGLWDLEAGPSGLERRRTPAVDAFRRVVAGGTV